MTGEVHRYKARLIYQRSDYTSESANEDLYTPVLGKEAFRIFLSIAASRQYHMTHADVVCAFLNGPVLGEIYIVLPKEISDDEIGRAHV